jgi:hypothetical protein
MIHQLTIICFTVLITDVLSQNGKRGCSTNECVIQDHMFLIVFGITIGVLLIFGCFAFVICCCGKCSKRKSKRLNGDDIENSDQTETEYAIPINIKNIFESGQWSSRFYRHGSFHGPFLHEIVFNINQNTLRGNGIDDIGRFTLIGNISTELFTIDMIKKYHSKIGYAQKNHGHEAKIDLEWNDETCAFEGKWFVHRYKHKNEGLYELVKVKQSFNNINEHYNYI